MENCRGRGLNRLKLSQFKIPTQVKTKKCTKKEDKETTSEGINNPKESHLNNTPKHKGPQTGKGKQRAPNQKTGAHTQGTTNTQSKNYNIPTHSFQALEMSDMEKSWNSLRPALHISTI